MIQSRPQRRLNTQDPHYSTLSSKMEPVNQEVSKGGL